MKTLPNVYMNSKGKIYNSAIITFDTETTSMFKNPDGTITNTPKDKENRVALGCLYHWQFWIDGEFVLGRTMDELADTFEELQKQKGTKIVWVHNLSFEFQWLLNIFYMPRFNNLKLDVFAREAHKVMRCVWGSIEFRCSYFLTNMTLANASKEFGLKHGKASGDLDYTKLRGYTTPLTHQEKEYCRLDVLVLAELIKKFRDMYGTLDNIPMTSTGRIRRECLNKMKDYDKREIKEAFPDEEIFPILRQAFMGGYTHSNFIHTGYVVEDVDSFDIASSYPTVMISEKYPMRFERVKLDQVAPLSDDFAILYHVVFYDIQPLTRMNYLSKSRSVKCCGIKEDNGRIIRGEWAEYYMTDIDVHIVKENYKIGRCEVLEAWKAPKQYLPKPFLEFLFKLYEDKTALKGVEGMEEPYRQSKAFINGCYGMTVTNDICDDILFENGEFSKHELTLEEVKEQLEKKRDSKKTFLLYQWGVWITAYARRNLWKAIHAINEDIVYCDTDSTKILNTEAHKAFYDHYNEVIQRKIENSIKANRLTVNYPPKTAKGVPKPLGNFEHEDEYPVIGFKTLGAKKYCYEGNDNKLHLTLSGVTKKASDYLDGLDDFREGKVFNEDQSGRTISFYIGDQEPIDFVDYLGIPQHCEQRFAICIEPSTYVLGLTEDFRELINNSTHLKVYGED